MPAIHCRFSNIQNKVALHLSMAHPAQFIDHRDFELLEKHKCSDEKSCDEWMTYYKNKANETKKHIIAMHKPWTMERDLHEAAKRAIKIGVQQKRQEKKKTDPNEEIIARINDELDEARIKLQSHAKKSTSMRRMREQKLHEMDQYWKRHYHWNLVKNGWSWNDDSRFGRLYYVRPEVLQCVMNAGADETVGSMTKKVWKIREELNVTLVEGILEVSFA